MRLVFAITFIFLFLTPEFVEFPTISDLDIPNNKHREFLITFEESVYDENIDWMLDNTYFVQQTMSWNGETRTTSELVKELYSESLNENIDYITCWRNGGKERARFTAEKILYGCTISTSTPESSTGLIVAIGLRPDGTLSILFGN